MVVAALVAVLAAVVLAAAALAGCMAPCNALSNCVMSDWTCVLLNGLLLLDAVVRPPFWLASPSLSAW